MKITNFAAPMRLLSLLVIASAFSQSASAQVFITEWMYNANDGSGEFIEFTNRGATAIDFSGWSFDDDSRAAGTVSLSGFGIVNPGESVVLAEISASEFRTVWSLPSSVRVIGGNATNLGRADEINLYNASNTLVDRLTYGDQTFAGSIRTVGVSGNPLTTAALGAPFDPYGWVLAVVGDSFGSHFDINNVNLGNPGLFASAPAVPLPAAAWLMFSGLAGLVGIARRKHK